MDTTDRRGELSLLNLQDFTIMAARFLYGPYVKSALPTEEERIQWYYSFTRRAICG